jgi:hypothetical protein
MLNVLLFTFIGLLIGFYCSHVQYFIYKRTRQLAVIGRQRGYHLHHSLFGLILYTLPLFIHMSLLQVFFVVSIGTGIIIDHTLKEGFIFITKESNDHLNTLFLSMHFYLLLTTVSENTLSLAITMDI